MQILFWAFLYSCSVGFTKKSFCKIVFIFSNMCGCKKKKNSQQKTIFTLRKILIKIRLIFYRLFSKKQFWKKKISLSFVASLINIIFFYSSRKYNFLAPSLSHGKFSHFRSLLFAFSLIIYSLL